MHDRKHDRNVDEARHRAVDHPAAPHDRRHDRAAADAARMSADDHDGERDPSLSARSLAARGDAPDGSEDGATQDADGAA